MGFKNGAYAKCWSFEQTSPKVTKVRLSVSRKTDSGYESDFSGFVSFIGSANDKVKKLWEGARIRLDECDVSTRYDKAKNKEYINYKVFDFSIPADDDRPSEAKKPTKQAAYDEGEVEDEDGLPFE